MLLGLLGGFFLCFYGYVLKNLLVRLRSVVSGSFVALAISLYAYSKVPLMTALKNENPLINLWQVIFNTNDFAGVILHLASFSIGGLFLFVLARNKAKLIQSIVAIFTAISMSLIIFLLLLSFLPFTPSAIVTGVAMVVILAFSLTRFESYMALESAITGSLIVAWLLARFWYLQFWLFFALWAAFAFLGILNQMHMLEKRGTENG